MQIKQTMRFETEKTQVNCIRVVDNQNTGITETVVATFDTHLDEIAPHIIVSLTADEQYQLMQWLNDREILREQSIKLLILYGLPGLLEEARTAIDKLPTISAELHNGISVTIASFNDALLANKNNISKSKENPELKQMSSSDALKEILGILKRNI
jgi:hypothetical protein